MLKIFMLCFGLSSTVFAAEFQLPADKAKKYADLYCKDLPKKNAQIEALNQLTLANNQKLKKGSYALYEGTRQSYDAQGRQTESGNFQERWQVVEINDQEATIEIQMDGRPLKQMTRELKKGLFNVTLSVEKPINCLYWANFAAQLTEDMMNINGKMVKVWVRKQTMLGNVEPTFTYAASVPFDLAQYKEVTHLQNRKEVVQRTLKEFSF